MKLDLLKQILRSTEAAHNEDILGPVRKSKAFKLEEIVPEECDSAPESL